MTTAPNPLLAPPFYIIPGINPSSPISAQIEQIDQLNTLLLQEIDANFAKFHQIVTTRILPGIKRFAIAGEPTKEAAQVSCLRSTWALTTLSPVLAVILRSRGGRPGAHPGRRHSFRRLGAR